MKISKGSYLIAAACIVLAGCGSADTDVVSSGDTESMPSVAPKVVEYQAEVVGADSVTVEFATDSGSMSETLPPTSTGENRVRMTTKSGAAIDSQHGAVSTRGSNVVLQ